MGFVGYDSKLGEIIFETQRHKHYVKVSAVHVKSGTEISVLCPITASEDILQHVAVSKLEYVMRKQTTYVLKV